MKISIQSSLVVLVALVLWGCATSARQSIAFDPKDFKEVAPGTASIHGHAFVRTQNGRNHSAAGLNVYLVPLVPYTEERAKLMEAGKDPESSDPRLARYVKTVIADVDGAYEFKDLPAGNYLLYSKVEWENPNRVGKYYAVARTEVREGETKNVVVTGSD